MDKEVVSNGEKIEFFPFFRSFWETLKDIPNDEDFRECINSVCAYTFDGKEPEALSFAPKMFFTMARPYIDKNLKARRDGQKGAKFGKLGGNPNFTKGKRNPYYDNPQDNPQDNPNKNKNKNKEQEIEKEIEKDIQKSANGATVCVGDVSHNAPKTKFVKPTFDQLQAYISENALNVDAGAFLDYYESKGWIVGKNPMKDWRAAARNWSRRNGPTVPTPQHPSNVVLGAGEWIENGRRTYGTGVATIPLSAPPRPSEQFAWNPSTQQWIVQ